MYVSIQSEKRLWTVGYYDPSGRWVPESDHGSPEEAADRVCRLNGGNPDPPGPPAAAREFPPSGGID